MIEVSTKNKLIGIVIGLLVGALHFLLDNWQYDLDEYSIIFIFKFVIEPVAALLIFIVLDYLLNLFDIHKKVPQKEILLPSITIVLVVTIFASIGMEKSDAGVFSALELKYLITSIIGLLIYLVLKRTRDPVRGT